MEVEEEEIFCEKSDLNISFKDAFDFQSKKETKLYKDTSQFLSKARRPIEEKDCIDSDVADEVYIVLLAKLLFDDDQRPIDDILSASKIVKSNLLKTILQGSFSMVIMLLGMYFYYAIGGVVLLFVAAYYGFRASDFLWTKHYRRKHLERLITVLQTNCKLMRKTMKFLIENERVLKGCLLEFQKIQETKSLDFEKTYQHQILNRKLKSFRNLEKDLINFEVNCIQTFVKYTNILLKLCPLSYDSLNEVYFCNSSYLKDESTTNYVELYHIYLLTQSEFLQKLVFSLIPNIQVKTNDKPLELQKTISKMCIDLQILSKELNSKFKYVFFNGIHKGNNRKPELKVDSENKDKQQLLINIHNLSNTFQSLLIKARSLENNLEDGLSHMNVEKILLNLKNDLIYCEGDIENSLIFLNRFNNPSVESVKFKNVTEVTEVGDKDIKQIQVGYSDLDPKVNDEIFEAYLTGDKCQFTDDFVADEYHDRKKFEKEYSKNVLKELKTKLIVKAKEWEIREAKILKDKGYVDTVPENEIKVLKDLHNTETKNISGKLSKSSPKSEDSNEDLVNYDVNLPTNNWPLPSYKKSCIFHCKTKKRPVVCTNGKDLPNSDIGTQKCEEQPQIFLNTLPVEKAVGEEEFRFKPDEMNLIAQSVLDARKAFLGSDLEEESFCGSGENSEEDIET